MEDTNGRAPTSPHNTQISPIDVFGNDIPSPIVSQEGSPQGQGLAAEPEEVPPDEEGDPEGDAEEAASTASDEDAEEGQSPHSPVFQFSTAQAYPRDLWRVDWSVAYQSFPLLSKFWKVAHDPNVKRPFGIKLLKDRMFYLERLCVPACFHESLIHEHHAFLGHVGGSKL